ncbi:MAG: Ig-like domain-containing protein [Acetobacteraceae bacterium]|nr:Ig-like domain-containing protein [Acetobacteraceae bacterium]
MTFQPRSTGRFSAWLALALGAVLLQGCGENKPAPAASSTRIFAADFAGAAKSCVVPKPTLKDGDVTDVAMKVGNDGGWCAITVAQKNDRPYDAGLLTTRPNHGKVFIHEVGDATRIDYTPDHAFVGTDTFTVRLLPGNPGLRASVTVAAP